MAEIHRTHTGKEKFTLKFGKCKGTGHLGVKRGITFEQILKNQDVSVRIVFSWG
jgi:hypothetical protein